jgi:N-6 DNA Methylase
MATKKGREIHGVQSAKTDEFLKLFSGIAREKHRYDVFRDFVTCAAISMHNVAHKGTARAVVLEAEYMAIVGKYSKEDVLSFSKLLALLIEMSESHPHDVLGQLFMSLDLGSDHTGQFFTPPEISELMAKMIYGDELRTMDKPFITLCEPACGAGGMVLAFAKVMMDAGVDPNQRLWVQAQDIDRLAALMCYVQLYLWHIPAVVIVGNTLACESREVFTTLAHVLGGWGLRIRRLRAEQDAVALMTETSTATDKPSHEVQFAGAMHVTVEDRSDHAGSPVRDHDETESEQPSRGRVFVTLPVGAVQAGFEF